MIVKLSPNSKFTTIGDIQRAGSDEKIEEVGSEASDEDSSIALCIVVENWVYSVGFHIEGSECEGWPI